MADFPEKLRHGDDIKRSVFDKFNKMIDYLHSTEIKGDNKTLMINRTPGGTIVKAIGRGGRSDGGSAFEYNGPYAVKFKMDEDTGKEDQGTLTINAGFVLCNGVMCECAESEVSTQEGYVCVYTGIEENSEGEEVKIIEPEIRIEEELDETLYPIAKIKMDEEGKNFEITQFFAPVAIFMITYRCPVSEGNEGDEAQSGPAK